MGALTGFAPFLVFAVVEKVLGLAAGLACGAAVSIALLVRDRLRGEREVNLLEAGSVLIFAGLAALALTEGAAWSVWEVRLCTDGGMLLVVLYSIVAGRPFTAQRARRVVSAEVAQSARFLRTHTRISGAWALAFAVLVAADLLMALRPETAVLLPIAVTVAALAAAACFTKWYPDWVRIHLDSAQSPATLKEGDAPSQGLPERRSSRTRATVRAIEIM